MTALYLCQAPDWTDQTVEERLRLCAEMLFARQLIGHRAYNQITTAVRDTAMRQRLQAAGRKRGCAR